LTEAFTIAQFQQLFDVNVYGVARVNRAVLPAMRKQRSGLLIHVSSSAGRVAAPGMAVYCASKFALEAIADSYRYELSPFGIDSVLVEPGMHRTPILEKFLPPADQARVSDYGAAATSVERVKSVFDAGMAAPETPDSGPVVEAFVRLIETPAGERPFRTVPTASVQPLLEPYNAMAADMRQVIAQRFNVTDFTVLQRSTSTTN
jgi:NAD(P)-dependent dehydrogenase (short-subunit alcohol dehydrogenase family)